MGINLNTQWDINSRSGFLTEQLYTSPAFFALGVATDPSNSSRNILAVCDQIIQVLIAFTYYCCYTCRWIRVD